MEITEQQEKHRDSNDPQKAKKIVDNPSFSLQAISEKLEEIKRHGFGEIHIEVFKGEVRSILVTQSWRRKIE